MKRIIQQWIVQQWIVLFLLVALAGCTGGGDEDDQSVHVWGRRGLGEGRFQKPRAVSIDSKDNLYIVDMTGRIQVFDPDGKLLRFWRTPEIYHGKPCGLAMSQDNKLVVADTHYHRVLFYELDGTLIDSRTIGGEHGRGPGQFGFLTDIAQDSKGNYYVSEYGDYDRIQKFDPDGKYVYEWGGHGSEPGEFLRPQGLLMDDKDQLWVADASNHRIQIFDVSGDKPVHVKSWGSMGRELGQMRYPYDMFFDDQGHVYVCEFGNHRIQKFTLEGKGIAVWGGPGREVGQLHQPWGMISDQTGRIHVLDSYNHRVQRFRWID